MMVRTKAIATCVYSAWKDELPDATGQSPANEREIGEETERRAPLQ